MARSDDPHAADVFDFVDAYVAARERGEDPPLAHWLGRFPASQEAVAHEWLNLRRPEEVAGAGGAKAPDLGGTDRIGPYRLISELGRGGQGTVFLAEDTRILRRVALKVLATRFDTIRDDKLRRFRREAEIIARLEHPSLCTVYEADLESATPYLAMRYVEGRTLAEVLADAKKLAEPGGAPASGADRADAFRLDAGDDTTPRAVDARFPPRSKLELDQVLLFFERAARALHAAHEAGVVHRDVKPGNVIVTLDGKPVLLDFGLARDESETDASRITESGEVFGTPAYMSPEQLELASEALDRRTDVYSLGVALYEALTLHRPFEQAARPALYMAIQSQAPPDPRSFNAKLPEDVAVVLETALEKDRARRYATALDLAEDLRRIRQYEPIRARPAGVRVRFVRWVRKHPALAATTIGTIVSLTAGLLVALNLLSAETRAVSAKDQALCEKDAALEVALGKHLAQRSIELVSEDASAALALGIQAAERAPGYQTMSALYPALEGCWLERVLAGDETSQLMTDLAVDPRGQYAVGAFPDGVAHVWELATGARVSRIAAGHGAIDLLEIDPAGERVALATIDGSITLARLADGSILGTIATGQRATRLEFSRDTRHLLTRAATGAVRVLDLTGLEVLAERPGPYVDARWSADGRILLFGTSGFDLADVRLSGEPQAAPGAEAASLAVDAAADGSWFALALDSGEIEIRDGRSLAVQRVRAPATPVRSLSIAPHGHRMVLGCGPDESATAWVWSSDGEPVELALPGRRPGARLVWSPDGERIAVASGEPIVRVYDARTGGIVRTFPLTRRQLDVAWSPDGSRVVTATSGFAYVWFAHARPDTFDLVGHAGAVRALRLAEDGDRVLSACSDGTARVWSIAAGGLVVALPHGKPLVDARFAGHGAFAVTAGEDGVVRAWDSSTGASVASTPPTGGGIATIATQNAGAQVVIVGRDGHASVWDAAVPNATPVRVPIGPDGARVTCATYLGDGSRIAFGFANGTVVVTDSTGRERLAEHSFLRSGAAASAIVALDAARDGSELAVGCSDRFVRFWRPGDEQESRAERFVFYLRGIEWDPPAERVLALGLEPGTKAVRVLDAASGKTEMPHNAHRANITCAAFSDDGTQALTGASDGSVFVWSTRDGSPIVQRADLGSGVQSAIFARRPDGMSVVAGLEDGRIRVWPLDPLGAARRRQPRTLADWELKRERALAAPLPFD
ncbi:MAG: protein kinase [Planctomycetota bacterium]|nr:protein kinase [Planctomycetota bacterium]